jgi:hypothetical protein
MRVSGDRHVHRVEVTLMPAFTVQPANARKGMRKALPFLAIECPKCNAAPGKTCKLPRGNFGFVHDARRQEWLKQQEARNG